MRRSTAQQINLGLAIALLLLIISAVVFHFNIARLQANEGWVHHTYEVQSTLEATLSTLKDAETGQRGYVITGDERYLEPYQTAIAQLDNHLNRLRSLTSDNPSQQQRLTTVETTIAQRMANIRETIDRRRTQGRIAAEQLILTGRGKALMDSVRQQIATMQAEESRLLTLRQQQSQRSFRQATNSMLIALLLDLLLLALVYLLFRRDRRLRQQETARQQQLMTEIETERNRLETVVRQLPSAQSSPMPNRDA
jgi:CHASE3 domain sensor protein